MKPSTGYPAARRETVRRTIAVMQQRLREQRDLLFSPQLELAAARQMARTHRRLRIMRSQLR